MGDVSLPPSSVQEFAPNVVEPALFHLSTSKPSSQSNICMLITIISNSHLLRECLVLLLQNRWSINGGNNNADDIVITSNNEDSLTHLVLLDSGIGHDEVVTQIQKWRSLQASPHIIVLELKDDPDLVLSCIEAGAHGYALQGASSTELIQIVEQAHRGVAHCSPEITAKLFDRLMHSKTIRRSLEKPPLTRRELEVLHYLTKDYSNRDIASELVIEVRTVKHYVHSILQKLKVKYRRDAAQLALKHGWLA